MIDTQRRSLAEIPLSPPVSDEPQPLLQAREADYQLSCCPGSVSQVSKTHIRNGAGEIVETIG